VCGVYVRGALDEGPATLLPLLPSPVGRMGLLEFGTSIMGADSVGGVVARPKWRDVTVGCGGACFCGEDVGSDALAVLWLVDVSGSLLFFKAVRAACRMCQTCVVE